VIACGAHVEHAEFGIGEVIAVFGTTATVDFFGEKLDVDVGELVIRAGVNAPATVPSSGQLPTDLAFRRSFEAVNLGVVPADTDQLVKLTIGGDEVSRMICRVLGDAAKQGACRVFRG
jgi:hypothetical protein